MSDTGSDSGSGSDSDDRQQYKKGGKPGGKAAAAAAAANNTNSKKNGGKAAAAAAAAASASESSMSKKNSSSVTNDNDGDDDDDNNPEYAGMSRKERKKIEAQKKFAAEMDELQKQAAGVHDRNSGESPWAVSFESDATHEGSRNVIFNNVSISINGKPLFKDTNVRFNAGFRYALVAPNGRGKSSLLTLLRTRELPIQKSLHVMLVEQEQELDGGDLTPVQAVLRSHKQLADFSAEAAVLREKTDLSDEQMKRLQYLEDELMLMGAEQAEPKVRKILYGLGFPFEWQDRPTSSFSGGWRKRIALASAVFIEPDMLMLDEPTNHLDLNAVIWLENYLSAQYNENARRPKILIVVSHDAGFLDGLCTHVVHIETCRLHYYRGNFSQFEAQLEQTRADADKKHTQYTKLINQKKRDGMSNAQVETWLKEQVRLGKISEEFLEKRRDYVVTFPFREPPELRDGCVIKLEDIEFNYPGGPTLFKNVSAALWTDTRVTIVGPNGIGKSTLISLLTGELEPVSGHANINRQVRIGRYTQHFMDKIPLEKTPVEYVISLGMKDEFEARHLLGSFGLESICHHQMCASLSGGQKARVALASISTIVPHFILFDEPTNHLDLESIEALCDAINNFKGGVLVVTHDARLIERTNMQLWLVGDLNVKPFSGDLHDYKAMIRKQFEELERQREMERDAKAAEKRLVKQLGGEEKAAVAMEERKQAQAAAAQDLFAALDAVAAKPAPKKKKTKKEEDDAAAAAAADGAAGAAAAAAESSGGAGEGAKKVVVKKVVKVVKKTGDKSGSAE